MLYIIFIMKAISRGNTPHESRPSGISLWLHEASVLIFPSYHHICMMVLLNDQVSSNGVYSIPSQETVKAAARRARHWGGGLARQLFILIFNCNQVLVTFLPFLCFSLPQSLRWHVVMMLCTETSYDMDDVTTHGKGMVPRPRNLTAHCRIDLVLKK